LNFSSKISLLYDIRYDVTVLHPLLFFSRISIALGLKAEARPADLFGQIGRIEVSQQYLSRFSLIIGIADGFLDRLYQLMVGLAPSISIASGLSLSRRVPVYQLLV
jgi:hypothetical protein